MSQQWLTGDLSTDYYMAQRYNQLVFGMTMEIGVGYQLMEDLILTAALHSSSSLTSVENLQDNSRTPVSYVPTRYLSERAYSQLLSFGLRLGVTYQFGH